MHSLRLALTSFLLSTAASQSLDSVLSNHGSFSMLHDLLVQHDLLDELSSTPNQTFFAITNKAIRGLADFGINLTTADPNIARAIFKYAQLDQIYTTDSVHSEWEAEVVHSVLQPPLFNNVTKGQAAKLRRSGSGKEHGIVLETGLGILTPVVEADIPFDHGVLHAIDSNMVLPHNISETTRLGGMTEFLRLLEISDSVSTLETLADVTIFIPQDEAITKLNPVLDMLKTEQLASVVAQHAVPNTVLYQALIGMSETLETLAGGTLQIRRGRRGEIFVNDAEVVRTDLLLYGGVAHMIDSVLLPEQDLSSCDDSAPFRPKVTLTSSNSFQKAWSFIASPKLMLGTLFSLAAVSALLRAYRSREYNRQQIELPESLGKHY